jgi:hypothetical protein
LSSLGFANANPDCTWAWRAEALNGDLMPLSDIDQDDAKLAAKIVDAIKEYDAANTRNTTTRRQRLG